MKKLLYITLFLCIIQTQSLFSQIIKTDNYKDIHKSVIDQLNLNTNEKDLAENAFEYFDYAYQWIDNANKIEEDKARLSEIMKLSTSYKDIYAKTKRKYEHLKGSQLSLQYDAEEYFELANSILFDIYTNHAEEIHKSNKNDIKLIVAQRTCIIKPGKYVTMFIIILIMNLVFHIYARLRVTKTRHCRSMRKHIC